MRCPTTSAGRADTGTSASATPWQRSSRRFACCGLSCRAIAPSIARCRQYALAQSHAVCSEPLCFPQLTASSAGRILPRDSDKPTEKLLGRRACAVASSSSWPQRHWRWRAGESAGAGTELARAAGQADPALRAGRRHRSHRPALGRQAHPGLRPAVRHREPRRGERHHRHRGCGQSGARRLHLPAHAQCAARPCSRCCARRRTIR